MEIHIEQVENGYILETEYPDGGRDGFKSTTYVFLTWLAASERVGKLFDKWLKDQVARGEL